MRNKNSRKLLHRLIKANTALQIRHLFRTLNKYQTRSDHNEKAIKNLSLTAVGPRRVV